MSKASITTNVSVQEPYSMKFNRDFFLKLFWNRVVAYFLIFFFLFFIPPVGYLINDGWEKSIWSTVLLSPILILIYYLVIWGTRYAWKLHRYQEMIIKSDRITLNGKGIITNIYFADIRICKISNENSGFTFGGDKNRKLLLQTSSARYVFFDIYFYKSKAAETFFNKITELIEDFKNIEIENLLEYLKDRHVILIGGDPQDREYLLEKVKEHFSGARPIFELPAKIANSEAYIEAIRKEFPIESPQGIPRAEMDNNQITDMDLDWTKNVPDALIFWHHIPKWNKRDLPQFYQFLNSYVSLKWYAENQHLKHNVRLIASAEITPKAFYDNAEVFYDIGGRQPSEVAKEHLVFLSLPKLSAEEVNP